VTACLVCLRRLEGDGAYHPRCARLLFGSARRPSARALAPAPPPAHDQIRFIIKPQTPSFPELPEIALVTLRLAELVGIQVARCGLVDSGDGTPALVVRRFDRLDDGRELPCEDFCELAGLAPAQRYDGSAELCADIVRKFATEPPIESLKLFRLMVYCWWAGHGDAHLQRFALLTGIDGVTRLSPAHDLMCTRLTLPDNQLMLPHDQLVLPVGGKKDGLRRADWEEFGRYCGLPPRSIARELARFPAALGKAAALLSMAPLRPPFRAQYAELLLARTAALAP